MIVSKEIFSLLARIAKIVDNRGGPSSHWLVNLGNHCATLGILRVEFGRGTVKAIGNVSDNLIQDAAYYYYKALA